MTVTKTQKTEIRITGYGHPILLVFLPNRMTIEEGFADRGFNKEAALEVATQILQHYGEAAPGVIRWGSGDEQ
jgi:hypothetical protein